MPKFLAMICPTGTRVLQHDSAEILVIWGERMVATQPKATWDGFFPKSQEAEAVPGCHAQDGWPESDFVDRQSHHHESLDTIGRRRIFVSAPRASTHDDRVRRAIAAVAGASPTVVAACVDAPLSVSKPSFSEAAYLTTKRFLDVSLSLVALVAFSPLLAIVGCLVRLTSRGPMIYAHTRIGENGKQFTCYKFRTMVADAEAQKASMEHLNVHSDSRTFKIPKDPRVTRLGNFLRRASIDELPQLWNVLLGDMSLVGPRPAIPAEVALYSADDCKRLAVKPGLTCIWQVSGRSKLAFPEQVRLDQEYVARRSLWLDMWLIMLTIPAVLRSDGAY